MPAVVAEVGLDDVDVLPLQHLPVAPLGEGPLAGGQVHRQAGLAHALEAEDVVRGDGLLEEEQVVRLQRLAEADRGRRAQAPVDVAHQLHVLAAGLAQGVVGPGRLPHQDALVHRPRCCRPPPARGRT